MPRFRLYVQNTAVVTIINTGYYARPRYYNNDTRQK